MIYIQIYLKFLIISAIIGISFLFQPNIFSIPCTAFLFSELNNFYWC